MVEAGAASGAGRGGAAGAYGPDCLRARRSSAPLRGVGVGTEAGTAAAGACGGLVPAEAGALADGSGAGVGWDGWPGGCCGETACGMPSQSAGGGTGCPARDRVATRPAPIIPSTPAIAVPASSQVSRPVLRGAGSAGAAAACGGGPLGRSMEGKGLAPAAAAGGVGCTRVVMVAPPNAVRGACFPGRTRVRNGIPPAAYGPSSTGARNMMPTSTSAARLTVDCLGVCCCSTWFACPAAVPAAMPASCPPLNVL